MGAKEGTRMDMEGSGLWCGCPGDRHAPSRGPPSAGSVQMAAAGHRPGMAPLRAAGRGCGVGSG